MSALDIFSRPSRANEARVGLAGGIAERVRRYRTYRNTLNELESLSDRELDDLRLNRSSIRSVAYEAAYHN